jgi:hypothetical protein
VTLLVVLNVSPASDGVVSEGDVPNTSAPEPVSSDTAEIKFADVGVAKKVATPVPKPEIPVETGRPVQLVKVPEEGVPRAGVTRVGLVANTSAPEPVSSVTADAKFADEGVARNVATPVPKPVTTEIPTCDHEVLPLVSLVMKYPLAPAGTAAGRVKL